MTARPLQCRTVALAIDSAGIQHEGLRVQTARGPSSCGNGARNSIAVGTLDETAARRWCAPCLGEARRGVEPGRFQDLTKLSVKFFLRAGTREVDVAAAVKHIEPIVHQFGFQHPADIDLN
jgi:hypothetical protein